MNKTQAKIIKIYESEMVHLSYGKIARKVGKSKAYVYTTIKEYLRQNQVFGLKGKK